MVSALLQYPIHPSAYSFSLLQFLLLESSNRTNVWQVDLQFFISPLKRLLKDGIIFDTFLFCHIEVILGESFCTVVGLQICWAAASGPGFLYRLFDSLISGHFTLRQIQCHVTHKERFWHRSLPKLHHDQHVFNTTLTDALFSPSSSVGLHIVRYTFCPWQF